MNTPMASATEQLFERIVLFVNESRALLESNQLLELGGLDDRVGALCEAILHLSPEEREKYNIRLQELLGELKSLGESLVQKRDLIGGELNALGKHKKAVTAYRTTEAIDNYNSNKNETEE